MPNLAVAINIRTARGKRPEFLKALSEHAGKVLANEKGLLRFEILAPKEHQNNVLVYQLFADQNAYDVHRTGPAMQQLVMSLRPMVEKMQPIVCDVIG